MTQQLATPRATSVGRAARMPRLATRTLLTGGTIAGPLFVIAGLAQASLRGGYDLSRHPFSLLSNGELGWIQIANFVVTGLLFVAAGVGLRRVLRTGPGRTWGPRLIAGVGLGLIGGGVFVADPAMGFPAGAPPGSPAVISWHSTLHAVAFVVGFVSLIAAIVVFTRRFQALGERGWTAYTAASGVVFVALSGFGMSIGDYRVLTVAVAVGWGWASVMAAKARSEVTEGPR